MSDFTVISFYTQDWEYPVYAQRLMQDCQRLGLDYRIEELPSDQDYVKNCNKKPLFIRQKLMELQRPVLWVDADGSILKDPTSLRDPHISKHDLAGNTADWDANKIHVGSIWFNYSPAAIELVNDWCDKSQNNTHDDDVSFNGILGAHRARCKIQLLPQEYFVILKSINNTAPDDAVIVHRLSTGASKEQYKQRLAEVGA